MPRTFRLSLILAIAVVGTACGSGDDGGDGDDAGVCREVDREVLVDEQLSPEQPSSPFAVGADDDIWVSVVADGDVSGSALVSQVSGLYVVEEGAPVEFERDGTGAVVTDAPYLDFDEQGQFVPLESAPGSYQLWSIKSPEIQVVSCPPATD